ncbi:MAG: hypothetical protein ACI9F9_000689 [Candidatus Paceibacteria bacterium]
MQNSERSTNSHFPKSTSATPERLGCEYGVEPVSQFTSIRLIMPIRTALHACWLLATLSLTSHFANAQVDYPSANHPWGQRAKEGPDAEVDGWYYNLGITGLRAQLTEEEPTYLLVKHVFEDTPGEGKVRVGDYIIGAGRNRFETPHRNGYGMDKFGPDGPLLDFAVALEASQDSKRKGKLALTLLRDDKLIDVTLKVAQKYGTFSKSYPLDCGRSELILEELLDFLVQEQHEDGSFGIPTHNTFAPLALLASGTKKHMAAVKRNVKMHARTTSAEDSSGLINWRYMSAALVMSEYYLASGEKWVLSELQEVYDFLISSQYTDMSQINPKSYESHPHAVPDGELQAHGGWGHNPGFEGYGPICMLTGQGALSFALMDRCGIEIDRKRHEAAYAFLDRAAGSNGYVWYADSPAGDRDWADMGRTGAAGIANWMSPYKQSIYKRRALSHAAIIGEHPESFPDTHGSPIMGMGYSALAANVEKKAFAQLMEANRWWFTLAQCADGTFYYQPNRDNAGYGSDSRLSASAVTAFIFSIPKANLHITGSKKVKR